MPDIAIMSGMIGLRHKHFDVPPQHFVGKIAKQPDTGATINEDISRRVDDHNAINASGDKCLKQLISFHPRQKDGIRTLHPPPYPSIAQHSNNKVSIELRTGLGPIPDPKGSPTHILTGHGLIPTARGVITFADRKGLEEDAGRYYGSGGEYARSIG
jgi:hypothetical protein